MKRLAVVLVGMMFLLGMALVPGSFAQAPSGDLSRAITPALDCPPGQFDPSYGKCKQPPQEQPASDVTKAVTPASSECPPYQWDPSYGKCKQAPQEAAGDTKKITPASSDCPPGKFDPSYGKCKE